MSEDLNRVIIRVTTVINSKMRIMKSQKNVITMMIQIIERQTAQND